MVFCFLYKYRWYYSYFFDFVNICKIEICKIDIYKVYLVWELVIISKSISEIKNI